MSESGSRWFEDYTPGRVFELGPVSVGEAEILSFGRAYDPQTIHTDPVAARSGPFGGVIASGWQTLGLMMRVFATGYLDVSNLGSPGVDEVRWPNPVRPDDELWVTITVIDARPSASKPDRGVVRSRVEVRNKDRQPVATLTVVNLILCRPKTVSSTG